MKTLIIPTTLAQTKLDCDGVIIGLKGLSVNMPNYFDITDLKKIKNKEIFICLNKNMHNNELKLLEETLIKLNDYPIKGVLFYDFAIPNLKDKLNYDLVWNQEHMTNNYYTINYLKELGINYTFVSSDITLREMQEIKQNSTSKLLVTLFGYLPLFTSKRPLVNNYLKTFNLKDTAKTNYLEKEGHLYPIVSDDQTVLYSDFILDGLKESLELNYDYMVLNSFKIEPSLFEKVLKIFKEVNIDNIDDKNKLLNNLIPNLKKGFFYEETVYKVK
ncbi:MAG: U32 family peptidase [Bacilli bacterium]